MALAATVLCNNILRRAFEEKIPVTPMKLQKILYFVSCEYVKNTNDELLSENFAVWQYGPVLPALYNEFKAFGGNSITAYAKDASGGSYAYNEDTAPNLKIAIDRIWESFKGMNGITLSQITHSEGSGWSNAFHNGQQTITKEQMRADDSYGKYFFN